MDLEITALEKLLARYHSFGEDTFEWLVDTAELRREWEGGGLTPVGDPESWWWIEYPCAVVHSPGAFWVTSWILK